MNEQLQQLNDRIKILEDFILSLQADTSIPLEVDRAFSSRLEVAKGSISGKTAASATKIVDSVPVMYPPDGFITITINNTPRNIPYIN